jgi:hypothetical protein
MVSQRGSTAAALHVILNRHRHGDTQASEAKSLAPAAVGPEQASDSGCLATEAEVRAVLDQGVRAHRIAQRNVGSTILYCKSLPPAPTPWWLT